YFPAAEQSDGKPQVSAAVQTRASVASPRPMARALSAPLPGLLDFSADQIDPYDLAEQLCSRPPGTESRFPAMMAGLAFDPAATLSGLAGPFGPAGLDDRDEDEDEDDAPISPEHAVLHQAIEEHILGLDPDAVCNLATAVEFAEPIRVTHRPTGSRTKTR